MNSGIGATAVFPEHRLDPKLVARADVAIPRRGCALHAKDWLRAKKLRSSPQPVLRIFPRTSRRGRRRRFHSLVPASTWLDRGRERVRSPSPFAPSAPRRPALDLVVCEMLLTGFDAQVEQVIYLDHR